MRNRIWRFVLLGLGAALMVFVNTQLGSRWPMWVNVVGWAVLVLIDWPLPVKMKAAGWVENFVAMAVILLVISILGLRADKVLWVFAGWSNRIAWIVLAGVCVVYLSGSLLRALALYRKRNGPRDEEFCG